MASDRDPRSSHLRLVTEYDSDEIEFEHDASEQPSAWTQLRDGLLDLVWIGGCGTWPLIRFFLWPVLAAKLVLSVVLSSRELFIGFLVGFTAAKAWSFYLRTYQPRTEWGWRAR